jgi:hypothetical protein
LSKESTCTLSALHAVDLLAASWLYGNVEERRSVDDGQQIKGYYQALVRSQVHGKGWKTISMTSTRIKLLKFAWNVILDLDCMQKLASHL